MHAIRFRALQQAHVAYALGGRTERIHQVAQHVEVGVHLITLAPTGNEARLLKHRRVHDMSHVGKTRSGGLARGSVAEVEWDVTPFPGTLNLGFGTRHSDHFVTLGEELLDRRQSNKSTGPGDENGSGHLYSFVWLVASNEGNRPARRSHFR